MYKLNTNHRFPAVLMAPSLVLSLLCVSAATGAHAAAADPQGLHLGFSPTAGVTSLTNGSDQLLSSGDFHAVDVVLTRFDGVPVSVDTQTSRETINVAARIVTRVYSWGTIACTYIPTGNRVSMHVSIVNHSPYVLKGLVLQLMSLKFPQALKSFEDNTREGANVDCPTTVGVDYGRGVLALANDDVGRPLYFGLPAGDPKVASSVYPVLAATYRDPLFPNVWMQTPKIQRPIYPGESDHLNLSLRVGPAGSDPLDLVSDVDAAYAQAYPPTLTWPDRSPIGYLMLSVTVPHPANGKNPRGWFANDPTVDVTTPAGLAAFDQRMLAYVDNSIQYLKAAHAQGVIIWDLEGQEYPHAQSYEGDPRHLPAEIDTIADQMFKKYTDAGLKVGVCLRPQRPMKTIYGDITDQVEVADVTFNLEDKIAYAKKRWGCTIFYVDSNAHHDPSMSWSEESAYELFPASIFQEVAAANPDCLLIPEQQTTRYYAYAPPYDELGQGVASTPLSVRRVYPGAFTVIQVSTDTSGGPLDTRRPELIQSIKRGDILLYRTWYQTPELQPVEDIYKAAGR